VTEIVEDKHPSSNPTEVVVRVTDEMLAKHYATQETWKAPTDCDRIDAAFSALERRGILARQHFSCCGDCAHSDIVKEIEAFKTAKPIGYAYYSVEETVSAYEQGELPISFGDIDSTDDGSLEVGRIICETLANERLHVTWDGTRESCICLTGLDWKKRRTKEI
jgi:hypothetical protein